MQNVCISLGELLYFFIFVHFLDLCLPFLAPPETPQCKTQEHHIDLEVDEQTSQISSTQTTFCTTGFVKLANKINIGTGRNCHNQAGKLRTESMSFEAIFESTLQQVKELEAYCLP